MTDTGEPLPSHDADVVNLLWTGGWDSTFRLLELVLVKQRVVRPHYVIDTHRRSFAREIQAMHKIKHLVVERFPGAQERLLPTEFKELGDIKPDPAIAEEYQGVAAIQHLGIQYEWLARYAAENGASYLELCIEAGEGAHPLLDPCGGSQFSLIRETRGNLSFYRVMDEPSNPNVAMFGRFRFPLLDVSKLEMEAQSVEAGFSDIMECTWFCHAPRRSGRACGTCAPCRITIKGGLGRRIHRLSRLRYRVWQAREMARGILHRVAGRVGYRHSRSCSQGNYG